MVWEPWASTTENTTTQSSLSARCLHRTSGIEALLGATNRIGRKECYGGNQEQKVRLNPYRGGIGSICLIVLGLQRRPLRIWSPTTLWCQERDCLCLARLRWDIKIAAQCFSSEQLVRRYCVHTKEGLKEVCLGILPKKCKLICWSCRIRLLWSNVTWRIRSMGRIRAKFPFIHEACRWWLAIVESLNAFILTSHRLLTLNIDIGPATPSLPFTL